MAEPTPEEREALAAGRAEHARGEILTHDDILHNLEARLREEGRKKPQKATAR